MKEILAIISQKGGVGKSTTAEILGELLSSMEYKVLLVDMDAQGNLSYALKADTSSTSQPTIMNVLLTPKTIKQAIQVTERANIIASSPALTGADVVLTDVGKEYRLSEALDQVKNDYDYIIIDTPPALCIPTVNALTACTSCIIAAQADIYSLQGIANLSNIINTIKHYCNKALSIRGILLTRYNPRTTLSKNITTTLTTIAEQMQTTLFETKIRECNAIREAQTTRTSLLKYSPKCNAISDYKSLIKELNL